MVGCRTAERTRSPRSSRYQPLHPHTACTESPISGYSTVVQSLVPHTEAFVNPCTRKQSAQRHPSVWSRQTGDPLVSCLHATSVSLRNHRQTDRQRQTNSERQTDKYSQTKTHLWTNRRTDGRTRDLRRHAVGRPALVFRKDLCHARTHLTGTHCPEMTSGTA